MTPFARDNLKFALQGKNILLGITASIAAFKACDLIRSLKDCGARVRVVLTQGAENFVTRTTLETLTGFPILSGFFESKSHEIQGLSRLEERAHLTHGTHHIDTARWADLFLVAPATANFLAKAAHGFADDLLSTEILAFRGPLLIAPAMNPTMFAHPAVQENLARLKKNGIKILGPEEGETACGEAGLGRMMETDVIVENVASCFHLTKKNKTLLITLGPTRSAIDPVRFISNRSSGKMGACLAWAALQEGYTVKAISGTLDLKLPSEIQVISVQTPQEMAEAALLAWKTAELFIGAAAVLDWEIQHFSPEKLKKDEGPPQIKFQPSPDILSLISQDKRSHQFVLGFAAETQDFVPQAVHKLHKKGCDAIFVNDVSQTNSGLESDFNGGWWISINHAPVFIPTCRKTNLARTLISRLPQLDRSDLHQKIIDSKKNISDPEMREG